MGRVSAGPECWCVSVRGAEKPGGIVESKQNATPRARRSKGPRQRSPPSPSPRGGPTRRSSGRGAAPLAAVEKGDPAPCGDPGHRGRPFQCSGRGARKGRRQERGQKRRPEPRARGEREVGGGGAKKQNGRYLSARWKAGVVGWTELCVGGACSALLCSALVVQIWPGSNEKGRSRRIAGGWRGAPLGTIVVVRQRKEEWVCVCDVASRGRLCDEKGRVNEKASEAAR